MTPKEARQALGLSQAAMAELLGGVDAMTVSRWERGLRVPDRAATELMELLVWLRENHPRILERWSKRRNKS